MVLLGPYTLLRACFHAHSKRLCALLYCTFKNLLQYSYFTMLYYFSIYNKLNQYVCISLFLSFIPSQSPQALLGSLYYTVGSQLVNLLYIVEYMSIPVSQFVHSPVFPLDIHRLLSMCIVSVFCFCDKLISKIF